MNKKYFIRHEDRNTWEITTGHKKETETADEAARRELFEEIGAIAFDIKFCVRIQ